MNDDVKRLEKQLEDLAARLRRVEAAVFSGYDAADAPRRAQPEARPPGDAETPEGFPGQAVLSFSGRSFMIMGGAFLLRWLTQSGVLPQEVGSLVGILYALLWIVMADAAAGRDHRLSAAFYGVTGAFIALPLLVEATTKFHFLTPTTSAISLLAFVIIGLAVAGRRKLRVLGWIIALPAAPLAFLLAMMTGGLLPFLLSLLALGVVTLWLGYLRGWHFLATLMSGAANVGLSLMVLERIKRTDTPNEISLPAALILLFGLIGIYFGSYCFRVFRKKRTITVLEISNTLVVLLVGLGGAAAVVNADEQSMLPLSIVCLLVSIACYVAAYGFLPRLDPNRRNFLFFTLLGLAMALLGVELVLSPSAAAVVFALIALIAGGMARPVASPILFLHAGAYLATATLLSHLLHVSSQGLFARTIDSGVWLSLPVIVALVVAVVYPWLPRPQGRATDVFLGVRLADFFMLVAVLSLAAVGTAAVIAVLPVDAAAASYRGALATTRTGLLATLAVIVAWNSNRSHLPRLTWLVYTVLAIGALKSLFEDLPAGGAATLFLSLGLYGGALILSPRMLRRATARRAD